MLVADVNPDALARLRAEHPDAEIAATADDVVDADLDLLSPCALGGAITPVVASRLQAPAICGGANNQLTEPGLDQVLADRGILYAPDFLVNAGGVVAVGQEYADHGRYRDEAARVRAQAIGDTLRDVLQRAASSGATPLVEAERLAEERIAAAPPRAPFAAVPTTTH